jgi:hypothetical protein
VGSTPRRFRHDLPSNIGVFGSIRPDLRLSVPLSGLRKLPENAIDRTVARATKWQCANYLWRHVAFQLTADYPSIIIQYIGRERTAMATTKRTFIAHSTYGEFSRRSSRDYRFCVVRADGWHQFSQTRAAAERELRYQENRGRQVELVLTDPTPQN